MSIDIIKHLAYLFRIGYIGLDKQGAPSESADNAGNLFCFFWIHNVVDDDISASFGKGAGNTFADPFHISRTRHQCDLVM